jgi:hypothetical protein
VSKGALWKTDVEDFARAVAEFEQALPDFWWSVGMCALGAHASCAVDGKSPMSARVVGGEPLDTGFHCDTQNGESVAYALRNVMAQALAYLKENP